MGDTKRVNPDEPKEDRPCVQVAIGDGDYPIQIHFAGVDWSAGDLSEISVSMPTLDSAETLRDSLSAFIAFYRGVNRGS